MTTDARTFEGMAAAVVSWHRARFPQAQLVHVALKLAEESGEVASAVNSLEGGDYGDGDVMAELADVVICAMVIAGRWFPEADILAAVATKLDVLTNPASGHRSALVGS